MAQYHFVSSIIKNKIKTTDKWHLVDATSATKDYKDDKIAHD